MQLARLPPVCFRSDLMAAIGSLNIPNRIHLKCALSVVYNVCAAVAHNVRLLVTVTLFMDTQEID